MALCRSVIARFTGGTTYFARIQTMIANAASSTKKVPFGTRKLLDSGTAEVPICCMRSAQHEDEQRHERQVDEEHRLHQTDGQEEDRLQTALGLRLTGDALDVRRTGEAVTDTGADRAAGEGHATADEGAGQLYRTTRCHVSPCLSCVLLARVRRLGLPVVPFLLVMIVVVRAGHAEVEHRQQREDECLQAAQEHRVEELP